MKNYIIVLFALFFSCGIAYAQNPSEKDSEQLPRNILSIGGGYGFISYLNWTKQSLSPWGKAYRQEMKGGMTFKAFYGRALNKNQDKMLRGWGGLLEMVHAKGDYILKDSYIPIEDGVLLTYIAPQYFETYRYKHLLAGIRLGIGYMNYHNAGKKAGKSCVTKGNGGGINFATQFTYLFGEHFGIGLELGLTAGFIGKLKQKTDGEAIVTIQSKKSDLDASHIDTMLHLNYYF